MNVFYNLLIRFRQIFRKRKVIKAFIVTYNEEAIIEITIQHYKKFCSEIYIFDNHSTDNTRKICEAMGCKVKLFDTAGALDDRAYLKIKNNAWKQHRDADYVIVCDADEIIKLPPVLTHAIYQCKGYQMYSEIMPYSWDEIQNGFSDSNYNKMILFDPKKVKEINYNFGCHRAKPVFFCFVNNKIDPDKILLKHMRYVGGLKRLVERYELYKSRMSDFNKDNNYGHQYLLDIQSLEKKWMEAKEKSNKIEY